MSVRLILRFFLVLSTLSLCSTALMAQDEAGLVKKSEKKVSPPASVVPA